MADIAVILIPGGIIVLRKNEVEIIECIARFPEEVPKLPVGRKIVFLAVDAQPIRIRHDDHGELHLFPAAQIPDAAKCLKIFVGNAELLQADCLLIPFVRFLPGYELHIRTQHLLRGLESLFRPVSRRIQNASCPLFPEGELHI